MSGVRFPSGPLFFLVLRLDYTDILKINQTKHLFQGPELDAFFFSFLFLFVPQKGIMATFPAELVNHAIPAVMMFAFPSPPLSLFQGCCASCWTCRVSPFFSFPRISSKTQSIYYLYSFKIPPTVLFFFLSLFFVHQFNCLILSFSLRLRTPESRYPTILHISNWAYIHQYHVFRQAEPSFRDSSAPCRVSNQSQLNSIMHLSYVTLRWPPSSQEPDSATNSRAVPIYATTVRPVPPLSSPSTILPECILIQ